MTTELCSNCRTQPVNRVGRCNACATFWYSNKKERPEELILAYNRRQDTRLRSLSPLHQSLVRLILTRNPSLEERWVRRLVEQIDIAIPRAWPDTCLIWMGRSNDAGYGQVKKARRHFYTHRLLYELVIGPIPDELVIDHLCRRPLCVNPLHLEPVTNAENIRRGNSAGAVVARTNRCLRGHEITPENTYTRRDNGHHQCRICRRERDRERARSRSVVFSV